MKKITVIVTFVLFHFNTAFANDTSITHVVMVWLKPTLTKSEVKHIISQTQPLANIQWVKKMKIGKPINSHRKIVDDSFSFGIIMEFENKMDMNQYLTHKSHIDYVNNLLKPALSKVVVYDF